MAKIGGNSLIAISSPFYERKLIYEEIIDKLSNCESRNDPTEINWHDNGSPSYSILQFKKSTFEDFCIKKYGLKNEIMNPNIQRECTDRMLEEDFDAIWKWANCWNKIKKEV